MAFGPMSVGNQATLSLLTDQTLTQENMPADAKATGTRLNTLDRGVDDLNKRIVKYLLLTGGTMTGELKAEGGIKGNLTGSATQWNNHTLTKKHANVTGNTWIPVFDANNTVNYATLDDLLRGATTRISTLEQKYQAIAKTTEVLLGTVVSPGIKGDTLQKGATHTMATFNSEVAFVIISGTKLLRGSSNVQLLWSIYNEGGGNYHRLYVRWDFTADGRVTATCDTEVSDTSWSWYDNTLKVNINYYSYAVAT